MQNYTDNADGDVPWTVENVWYFLSLWIQGARMFFWEEKQNFIKIFLCYDDNVSQLRQLTRDHVNLHVHKN